MRFSNFISGLLVAVVQLDPKPFIFKIFLDFLRILSVPFGDGNHHGLHGSQLLAFGDGFVEIEETKRVVGIAVGVATDEARRRGVDAWKRERLIQAGADVIVGDFREQEELLGYLLDGLGN